MPFTSNHDLFQNMAVVGNQLVNLHLLKSSEFDNSTVKYQGAGDNDAIETIGYKENDLKVYINQNKCFEGIDRTMWKYQIGGYQVLHKYLKDRKGRRMDDPRLYVQIANAIKQTIEIQQEIDCIYPALEKDLITFK